jgi:hypothetical protein
MKLVTASLLRKARLCSMGIEKFKYRHPNGIGIRRVINEWTDGPQLDDIYGAVDNLHYRIKLDDQREKEYQELIEKLDEEDDNEQLVNIEDDARAIYLNHIPLLEYMIELGHKL